MGSDRVEVKSDLSMYGSERGGWTTQRSKISILVDGHVGHLRTPPPIREVEEEGDGSRVGSKGQHPSPLIRPATMADPRTEEQQSVGVTNGKEDTADLPSSSAKPRARLGPTEVVILPNSDSEDEDEEDDAVNGEEKGSETDPDFLKTYPAETEVSAILIDGRRLTSRTCNCNIYV